MLLEQVPLAYVAFVDNFEPIKHIGLSGLSNRIV